MNCLKYFGKFTLPGISSFFWVYLVAVLNILNILIWWIKNFQKNFIFTMQITKWKLYMRRILADYYFLKVWGVIAHIFFITLFSCLLVFLFWHKIAYKICVFNNNKRWDKHKYTMFYTLYHTITSSEFFILIIIMPSSYKLPRKSGVWVNSFHYLAEKKCWFGQYLGWMVIGRWEDFFQYT